MTTTVEVYAGNFFRKIDAKRNTKFSDLCNRFFKRTAFYRPVNQINT